MTFALLATSAITPSLLLVWFFHARDVFPEPPRVLWTTFGLGVLIVVPVLVFALPMTRLAQSVDNPLLYGFISAFFAAAIPEELFKFLVVARYSMRHPEFDEPMDGIVYGATASLGFATLENILYVSDGSLSTALMRAFTAVPGHAFLGAIMGYYVGRARFAPPARQRSLMWRAFLVPMWLHGAYDFPLLAASKLEDPDSTVALPIFALLLLVPAILSLEWVWTTRLVRQARAHQLAAGAPPLPPADDRVAAAPETPPRRPGKVLGWTMTLLGGVLASVGGLVMLGVALALVIEGGQTEELGDLVLGTVLIGILPALIGSGIFYRGLKTLNQA